MASWHKRSPPKVINHVIDDNMYLPTPVSIIHLFMDGITYLMLAFEIAYHINSKPLLEILDIGLSCAKCNTNARDLPCSCAQKIMTKLITLLVI